MTNPSEVITLLSKLGEDCISEKNSYGFEKDGRPNSGPRMASVTATRQALQDAIEDLRRQQADALRAHPNELAPDNKG